MNRDNVGTTIARSVGKLEDVARRMRPGKTPERVELEQIAIRAAADGRGALKIYGDRGDEAGGTERHYRKMQYALSEVLADCKANERDRTPEAGHPVWRAYRMALAEPGEPTEKMMARPIPADMWVGELKTAGQQAVVINGICADARYFRDTALSRSRSAGKALAMFDRIINLMQSLMKQDALEERLSQGNAAELGWEEDEP